MIIIRFFPLKPSIYFDIIFPRIIQNSFQRSWEIKRHIKNKHKRKYFFKVIILLPFWFLPPLTHSSEIKKERFSFFLKWVEGVYRPLFSQKFNKVLTIEGQWEETEVNAHATRDLEDNPIVEVPGGLARHPLLTEDGFLLIICHELGHFLGGAPKMLRGESKKVGWSSAEGQADYFAANKCFKTLLVHQQWEQNEQVPPGLFTLQDEKEVAELCSDSACKRMLFASLSVAKMFAAVKWESVTPSLTSPTTREVEETSFFHPSAQCRLDTFVAGWFCPKSPGDEFDDLDPTRGACLDEGNATESPFKRPSCWFRP